MEDPTNLMFLESNGSTTKMLESFFKSTISVNVIEQRELKQSQISDSTRTKLNYRSTEVVVERLSDLYLDDSLKISTNRVLFKTANNPKLNEEIFNGRVPLGKIISSLNLPHIRKINKIGNIKTIFDHEVRVCAFKEYVIYVHSEPQFIITEIFNPDYILPIYEDK